MEKTDKPLIKNSALILSLIAGFFFAFFVRTEADLFKTENIEWNGKYIVSLTISCMAGAALYAGIYYFYKRVTEICIGRDNSIRKRLTSKQIFVASLIINVIVFFPFFLAYYPGIMAYDFPVQLEQIINSAYNTHHPLAHTLLLKGCLVIGEGIFKSAVCGVALCTFIQMLFLAVSLAFVMFTVNELGSSLLFEMLLQILFGFNLFNGFMAVSITKDVIFTGFVVLFVCSFVLICVKNTNRFNVLLFAGTLGVCLFRNNGLYALLFVLIIGVVSFFVQSNKNEKLVSGRTLCVIGVGLLFSIIILKGLSLMANATEGDKREMLSVPIQQLARVAVWEEGKLTADEQALIDEFLLYESYKDYNPVISDPVKGNTNTSVVRYQAGRFIRVYMSLLKKYPGDFINAFLSLVGGYVSPFDETYRIMRVNGETVTRNYIQHTFTAWGYEEVVHEESLLPLLKAKLDAFAEYDGFDIPVLKIFFIPGIYLWIYVWIFVYMVDKHDYRLLLPWFFVVAYFATLFLGPTMNLRYIYPIMVSLPVLLFGSIRRET